MFLVWRGVDEFNYSILHIQGGFDLTASRKETINRKEEKNKGKGEGSKGGVGRGETNEGRLGWIRGTSGRVFALREAI